MLVTSSCDNSPQQQDPLLANGWVTNCSGADFGKADTHRPIFRISDQLVLAVPPANHPSSNSIEKLPRACEKISDLPVAAFVSFVITGDWSSGYNQADIPTSGGIEQFQPDVVGARVEGEALGKQSAED